MLLVDFKNVIVCVCVCVYEAFLWDMTLLGMIQEMKEYQKEQMNGWRKDEMSRNTRMMEMIEWTIKCQSNAKHGFQLVSTKYKLIWM